MLVNSVNSVALSKIDVCVCVCVCVCVRVRVVFVTFDLHIDLPSWSDMAECGTERENGICTTS